MQSERVAAGLLVWALAAAGQLAPSTIASVNACLGPGPDTCYDRLGRQVVDGSVLSLNATLCTPALRAQLIINSTAQAGYGRLHAGASSTLDISGPAMPASSDAQAASTDIITISYARLNGKPGLLFVSYRLSGSVLSSDRNNSFAETQVFAGTSLEQRYSVRHSSSAWGLFSLPQPIRFTFGVPFGLKVVLVTTNIIAPNDGNSSGRTANFVDALVLSQLRLSDKFRNPVEGAQFSSASGTQYGTSGVVSGPSATRTPPPFIASLRPSSGPAGTLITVYGSGFTPNAGFMYTPAGVDNSGNTVQLGADIPLKNLNSSDGVTLRFQIPQNVSPAIYSATIVNENGMSNTVNLTVTRN